MGNEIQVVTRRGLRVLAKTYKGELHAVTYANRTQADHRAAQIPGAYVTARWPFLVVVAEEMAA